MIETGLDFNEAVKLTKRLVLPVGKYKFQISNITPGNTGEGRPQWTWELTVLDSDAHPEMIGKKVFINSVLPWIGGDGKVDTTGLFVLVGILSGIGKPWRGTSFDDTPALYMGAIGSADVRVGTIAKGEYAGDQQNSYKWLPA